jgi:calmodulin
MAAKAPGKAPAKPKAGAAKARPVVKQLTPEEKLAADIKEAFCLWDQDKDGRVSTRELASMMRAMGATPSEEQARSIAKLVDKEGTGTFTLKDFQDIMSRQAQTLKEADLIESFKVFDQTNTGFIAVQELRRMMTILGERLSKDEIDVLP